MAQVSHPPRPPRSRVDRDGIPPELIARKQWVTWIFAPQGKDGMHWTKVPLRPDGGAADSTAPSTWSSFDVVWAAYSAGRFDGVGFVLSDDDGLCCVDLDHCATDGRIHPSEQSIIDQLDTFTEWSQSDGGVHLWLSGHGHPTRRRNGRVEVYDSKRFICITGRSVAGTRPTIEARQAELDEIMAVIFGPEIVTSPAWHHHSLDRRTEAPASICP